MKGNERLDKFLKLQDKNIGFENIAKDIGISTTTLRKFLNKMGYKSENGKYVSYNSNLEKDIKISKPKINSKKETQISFEQINKNVNDKGKSSKNKLTKGNSKPKKDRKINITQEDLDKICEVYDWYLEVKDYKSMKPKKTTKKKDILIEELELKELKTASIKVEKNTWEDFERLCSNSSFTKQQIITQALKDFMKEYKNLL
ncbi:MULTISPECIES: DNA-binding protein [unclassified Romboutsia]|uniref:DNA-binding protein n=1 Tax=unclassified Romboutsia TaxID=2626894 RepID=UPI00082171B5|nr:MULTISPECIES: DNA-binding protein [unclassified Romboutsia]SCI16610.1 Uncharacterised protein [uncultured Clostridium sp.]